MSSFRIAAHIGVEDIETEVYAAPLPDGPIVILRDAAALIWREIAGDGLDAIVERVADVDGRAPDEIRDDVRAFLTGLAAQGLVVEV